MRQQPTNSEMSTVGTLLRGAQLFSCLIFSAFLGEPSTRLWSLTSLGMSCRSFVLETTISPDQGKAIIGGAAISLSLFLVRSRDSLHIVHGEVGQITSLALKAKAHGRSGVGGAEDNLASLHFD